MGNATFYYFLPVVVGGLLAVLGLWMFKRLTRDSDGGSSRSNVGCLGFALMVAGVVIALVGLVAPPTPWERQRRVDAIRMTPPDRIEHFIITAGRPGTYKPLVKSPVMIDDDARIKRITDILRAAKPITPDEPSAKWTAHVHMITAKETFTFTVAPSYDPRNGTIVTVTSGATGGWTLGQLRADGLEKILEDAASAVGKRRAD
jgi:hypothetical protein